MFSEEFGFPPRFAWDEGLADINNEAAAGHGIRQEHGLIERPSCGSPSSRGWGGRTVVTRIARPRIVNQLRQPASERMPRAGMWQMVRTIATAETN